MSCITSSECFAVGSAEEALIEEWTGSNWTTVNLGERKGKNRSLQGIDCVSATLCVAVGAEIVQGRTVPLVEMWNGNQWTKAASPSAGTVESSLSAVSCMSTTDCIAVGDWQNTNPKATSELFAESWNGTRWSITPMPVNPGDDTNTLTSIACTSGGTCFAAGKYSTGIEAGWYDTLIEQWNGAHWTKLTSPDPNLVNVLSGISCISSEKCTAVGDYADPNTGIWDTLVTKWNGSKWKIAASPNQEIGGQNNGNFLNAVSCSAKDNCLAVGSYWNAAGTPSTLAETWDGSTWSISPSPDVASQDNYSNTLAGVSCTTATSCVAVGEYSYDNAAQTLAASWNGGSWAIGTTVNPGGADSLAAVSCVNPTDCAAVGTYLNGQESMIETWDGTAWLTATTPVEGQTSALHGVSCSSSTSCMAVGTYGTAVDLYPLTLIESWNGTTWATSSSASPGTSENVLNAVSCTSSTSCIAVGFDSSGSALQTLVETWDGSSWSTTPSPDLGTVDNVLTGISCTDAGDFCVAVGYTQDSSGDTQPLIETWNGETWAIASSPDPDGIFNPLNSVSCADATDCVAVGTSYVSGSEDQALAYEWNGTDWTITPSPNDTVSNSLEGVSCDSATDCVAVGNTDYQPQTEIDDWNGVSWSPSASPNEGLSSLSGVSCSDSTDCVAVGGYQISNEGLSNETLVESGSTP